MSDPGFVNLDVRYVDIEEGYGVAVDSVIGRVINSKGEVVEDIIPDPLIDVDGTFYRKADYDIRDLSKFPGNFLEVSWSAVKAGLVIPGPSKRYDYPPVGRGFVDKTLIAWVRPELNKEPMWYNVYRYRKDIGTDLEVEELLGTSFGESFVDRTAYANEFEARSWSYRARPVTHTDNLNPDGSDYEERDLTIATSTMIRTAHGVCVLEGSMMTITGGSGFYRTSRQSTSIVFKVSEYDHFQFLGNTFLLIDEVFVTPGADGKFSVHLVQDAVIEMRITTSNFRGRFVVPRQDRVSLEDLEIEEVRT